jgi:hypothetical protein
LPADSRVDAVEALTASLGDAGDVFEPLTALVSHSLLRQEEQPDGEPRFAMLETIHAFARERLAEAGDEDAALTWASCSPSPRRRRPTCAARAAECLV